MSNFNFETVDVPVGAYVAWAPNPGQVVTGKVLSYDAAGGTDFQGNVCPQLSLELVDTAYSVNKAGERRDFAVGELVVINAGLANLKRAVQAAVLEVGDIVRITYSGHAQSANGTVKLFDIAVARGAGRTASAPQQQAPAQGFATPAAPAQQVSAAPPF